MSRGVVNNVIRFILLLLLQVLVLKRIDFGWENFNYVSFFIYPLFIIILPLKTSKPLLLLLGLLLGLSVDLFYDSLGVHAAAAVFTAFIRPYLLKAMEPRGGYPVNASPTKYYFSSNWFMLYAGILLFGHLLFYFSVEVFTFVYFFDIWLKTIFSFIFSFLTMMVIVILFNPK